MESTQAPGSSTSQYRSVNNEKAREEAFSVAGVRTSAPPGRINPDNNQSFLQTISDLYPVDSAVQSVLLFRQSSKLSVSPRRYKTLAAGSTTRRIRNFHCLPDGPEKCNSRKGSFTA